MTNKAKKLSKKLHIENKNISRKEIKKIQWIELGRALAIICVLLCHSVEIVYSSNLTINHYLNMEFMTGLSDLSKIFSHLTFTIGRLGVPIFLMITGYLMLDRNYDKAGCKIFYKRNFLHIFLCAEIWIILYNIFFMIYRNEAFSLSDLLKEMFFINWVNLDHWWFMNMIVIVYLLLPIAANIIKHCNKKFLKAIFIFYCIYTGLYKIIDDILLAFGRKDLPDSISLGYTYGIFVIYLVMGYLIKKGIFN